MIENKMFAQMFEGSIPKKPSRDFTCPLGTPRGLKSLLHMLNNATVLPRKWTYVYSIFSFGFAKGLAKYKFGGI
jgi:hypothetical protein